MCSGCMRKHFLGMAWHMGKSKSRVPKMILRTKTEIRKVLFLQADEDPEEAHLVGGTICESPHAFLSPYLWCMQVIKRNEKKIYDRL
uniref:Uncharacterized protein n=1 Tax=Rhizophora mucronata TaxID=61149 RepID=A0A2P2PU12_RHIMU